MAAKAAATASARTPMKFIEVISQAKSIKFASLFSIGSDSRVDNVIFSLHSTVTVTILTICMIFVGMKQYFGEPIECLNTLQNTANSLTHAQMQHYCWMEGAFTVANRYSGPINDGSLDSQEITGQDNAYPGVKNYKPHKGDSKILHKYYQWVYYILCIQCLLFYCPKHIWRMREGGRLRDLISKVKKKNVFQYAGLDRYEIVQDTLDVILTANQYFSWILFSEVLFFFHLICEIFFLHAFLGGKFLFLGFQWVHYALYSDENNNDPLIRLFPRLTKCSFHKFGVTGSIETYDTLCFMPLNIVNEKIFVVLWFWFLVLFLVTLYHLFIYRATFITFRWVRHKCLQSLSPTTDRGFIKKISKSPGRCFVVQMIATNMKPYAFRDLMHQVLADHFTVKGYKLECKVKIQDYIDKDKGIVPVSNLAAAIPLVVAEVTPNAPPEPGFKKFDDKSDTDSGVGNVAKSSGADDWDTPVAEETKSKGVWGGWEGDNKTEKKEETADTIAW